MHHMKQLLSDIPMQASPFSSPIMTVHWGHSHPAFLGQQDSVVVHGNHKTGNWNSQLGETARLYKLDMYMAIWYSYNGEKQPP